MTICILNFKIIQFRRINYYILNIHLSLMSIKKKSKLKKDIKRKKNYTYQTMNTSQKKCFMLREISDRKK